jgi:hypothetical protein
MNVENISLGGTPMATKAELFRSESERHSHKSPKVKKPRRVVDPHHTDTRNVTKRADKNSGPALEDSMSGKPSRKSTRTSSHHGRSDTQIMRAARAKSFTSKAQAGRSQAARKK